jgi:(1->4)-alpha-D-glucan 1-alpha-D-glucosylmutase
MKAAAPLATYRLQLTPTFDFRRASQTCGYLKALGISHLYLSPCMTAARGSLHGYDVVDPSRVNPELGGEEGFDALGRTLSELGLALVLDLVPNHMAIGSRENRWWWDVLVNGPASRYAGFFDIRWDPPNALLRNKVLVPILGDTLERCLLARQIQLRRRNDEILVGYFHYEMPVSPESLREMLPAAAEAAADPALNHLDGDAPAGSIRAEERSAAHRIVDAAIAEINSEPGRLERFLDRQHYRLAYWAAANRELNYRRFFDIYRLAGIRVEQEEVFAAVHERVLRWVTSGRIAGLRIDHPDGLRDPTGYLQRLREALPGAWIVVEKILESGEALSPEWPVAGTTGYDFLNVLAGLFIDPRGEGPLTEFYREFTGQTADYPEVVRAKKIQVLDRLFIAEMSRLLDLLEDIHGRSGGPPDFVRQDYREALTEVVADFPVYRTYIRPHTGSLSWRDRAVIREALAAAAAQRPDLVPALWRSLEDLLLLRRTGRTESDFVLRFQQLTGAAMAKGVEDTAFYCFNRLMALNEVGGNPGGFGTYPEDFHAFCRRVQADRPHTLLASATHDTKRGEDVRLRIGLLSEIPERWAQAVRRWSGMNARFRSNGFRDANSEYLLYQTLVGSWPIGSDRLVPYMLKAVREAKVHTSWTDPDPAFEQGLQAFVEAVLGHAEFTADLSAFLAPLVRPAMVTSLSQTLIKCTAPGIPDIYQGAELWDLSLVDPDNRRPVDFDGRLEMLNRLASLSLDQILDRHTEGVPKLFVIQRSLHARGRRAEAFGPHGGYQPLLATGSKALHVVAFIRGGQCLTVTPRLVVGLGDGWGDTRVELPAGVWRNVFTGERWTGGRQDVGRLLELFPVGLWLREEGSR